jgi:hypothetical protein
MITTLVVFCILFSLSVDYGALLLSRNWEEYGLHRGQRLSGRARLGEDRKAGHGRRDDRARSPGSRDDASSGPLELVGSQAACPALRPARPLRARCWERKAKPFPSVVRRCYIGHMCARDYKGWNADPRL